MVSPPLFNTEPGFLPLLENDETVYSWASRYHRRSGNAHPYVTGQILFGSKNAGLHHDFPAHLARLADLGVLDQPVTQLALNHTVLGAMAKFMSATNIDWAIADMSGSPIGNLKQRLGLLKSGCGASYRLKACAECIEKDSSSEAGAMWHLEHQWPTVWTCTRHGNVLRELSPNVRSTRFGQWHLPDAVMQEDWLLTPLSDPQHEHIGRLARLTANIAGMPERNLDPDCLRLTYQVGVDRLGLVCNSDGSTRFKQLVGVAQSHFCTLRDLPQWSFLADLDNSIAGLLGLLLRRQPGSRHLAKHVALIDLLFGDFVTFEAAYREVEAAVVAGSLDAINSQLQRTRHQLLQLVEQDGLSINQAAETIGVQPAQAVRWVKNAGIEYQGRPHVLDDRREKILVTLLKQGREIEEIVAILTIKRSWLRAYLAKHTVLRDTWRDIHQANTLKRYRAHFKKLADTHTGVPLKTIQQMAGSGYSWLYRHDRAWLAENLPFLRAERN